MEELPTLVPSLPSLPSLHSLVVIDENTSNQGLPKGIHKGDTLLWTKQASALSQKLMERKGLHGVEDNCFILSGPSGIGKSCLVLSVAALFMRLHETVLYLNDAGVLLSEAEDIASQQHDPSSMTVSRSLTVLIAEQLVAQNAQNANLTERVKEAVNNKGTLMGDITKILNDHQAIVIIDEQGSAYNKLKEKGDNSTFGMLYPNRWISNGQQVRIVLTGSNHSSFESTLNGTYSDCVSHVLPMDEEDAEALCTSMEWDLDPDDTKFYCNNVPREMRCLSGKNSPTAYLNDRQNQMHQLLATCLDAYTDKSRVLRMLKYLFQDRNLGYGDVLVPFVDLGFVFRKEVDGKLAWFPLCLAAEGALLGLWRDLDKITRPSLQECIQRSDDMGFKTLVFSTLVCRHNVPQSSAVLPCVTLGIGFAKPYLFDIDVVYTATCSTNEVANDIFQVRRVATARKLKVLYQCPKGTTVDFCVVSESVVIAIQVSLVLDLTNLEKPSADFLKSIGAPQHHNARNHEWLYVYITTTRPRLHPIIGSYKWWNGIEVDKIRLVDANTWI